MSSKAVSHQAAEAQHKDSAPHHAAVPYFFFSLFNRTGRRPPGRSRRTRAPAARRRSARTRARHRGTRHGNMDSTRHGNMHRTCTAHAHDRQQRRWSAQCALRFAGQREAVSDRGEAVVVGGPAPPTVGVRAATQSTDGPLCRRSRSRRRTEEGGTGGRDRRDRRDRKGGTCMVLGVP